MRLNGTKNDQIVERKAVNCSPRIMIRVGTQHAVPLTMAAPAVICIPPEKVYTALLHLPLGTRPSEETIRLETPRFFPESSADLPLAYSILSREKTGTNVGAAAMKESVLKKYIEVCTKAGVHIRSITTVPCVVAMEQNKKIGTFFLFLKTGTDAPSSLTLLHEGWPIDEDCLKAGAPPAEIIKAVTDMRQEYIKKELCVSEVYVAGSSALVAAISEGCTASKKVKGKKGDADVPMESETPFKVISLVSKEQDLEWIGASSAATTAAQPPLHMNESRSQGKLLWYFIAITILLGLLGALLY